MSPFAANSSCFIFPRIFTLLLMMYRVPGAILMGIFFTAIISWPRFTPVTYFPHTAAGDAAYDYFKQVVAFQRLQEIGNAIEACRHPYFFLSLELIFFCPKPSLQHNYWNPKVWLTLITFLYVDILSRSSTGYLVTI